MGKPVGLWSKNLQIQHPRGVIPSTGVAGLPMRSHHPRHKKCRHQTGNRRGGKDSAQCLKPPNIRNRDPARIPQCAAVPDLSPDPVSEVRKVSVPALHGSQGLFYSIRVHVSGNDVRSSKPSKFVALMIVWHTFQPDNTGKKNAAVGNRTPNLLICRNLHAPDFIRSCWCLSVVIGAYRPDPLQKEYQILRILQLPSKTVAPTSR